MSGPKYKVGETVPASTRLARRRPQTRITKRQPHGRLLRAVFDEDRNDPDGMGTLTLYYASKPAKIRRATPHLYGELT